MHQTSPRFAVGMCNMDLLDRPLCFRPQSKVKPFSRRLAGQQRSSRSTMGFFAKRTKFVVLSWFSRAWSKPRVTVHLQRHQQLDPDLVVAFHLSTVRNPCRPELCDWTGRKTKEKKKRKEKAFLFGNLNRAKKTASSRVKTALKNSVFYSNFALSLLTSH